MVHKKCRMKILVIKWKRSYYYHVILNSKFELMISEMVFKKEKHITYGMWKIGRTFKLSVMQARVYLLYDHLWDNETLLGGVSAQL